MEIGQIFHKKIHCFLENGLDNVFFQFPGIINVLFVLFVSSVQYSEFSIFRNLTLVFIFMVRGLSLGLFQGFYVYAPEVRCSLSSDLKIVFPYKPF